MTRSEQLTKAYDAWLYGHLIIEGKSYPNQSTRSNMMILWMLISAMEAVVVWYLFERMSLGIVMLIAVFLVFCMFIVNPVLAYNLLRKIHINRMKNYKEE